MQKNPLESEKVALLQQIINTGESYYWRVRCQCILLLYEGKSTKELAQIFNVKPSTIYDWVKRWHEGGVEALADSMGRGRKSPKETATLSL